MSSGHSESNHPPSEQRCNDDAPGSSSSRTRDPVAKAGAGADGESLHTGSRQTNEIYDNLIFKQELNEVYLLLDFISGRPDRKLTTLDKIITDPDSKTAMTAEEVIQRVSTIRYPPEKPGRENAKDAAFLLLLKDALNYIAFPARGMTIAYTTMFADEKPNAETSRREAARLCYPTLEANATYFRRWKSVFVWSALIAAILSAFLLLQVTYGAQLAARFDEAKRNDSSAAARVHEELNKQRVQDKDLQRDLRVVCRLTSESSKKEDNRDSTLQLLCGEYAYRHAQLCVAVADVGQYAQSWVFQGMAFFVPVHKPEAALSCENDDGVPQTDVQAGAGKVGRQEDAQSEVGENKRSVPQTDVQAAGSKVGRQEDAQSIVGVLSIMSNYVLPILFGLVGTLTALVRGIHNKISESVLSPRDNALALIRLPLGIVAGVCVGLFLAPGSVFAQSNGSVGSFTISASGVAFLAGYGAEAFFRALDNLLSKVFSLDARTTHVEKSNARGERAPGAAT